MPNLFRRCFVLTWLPLLLLIVTDFTLWKANAQVPVFDWAVKAGGSGDDFSRGIAIDAAGNTYVTGAFSGTASFGNTNLISAGGHDIFLAKFDALGTCVWARQAGSSASGIEEGRGVTVDGQGNVYLTGAFAGVASFGTTNLASAGALDIFLAHYTAAGALVWVRQAGGSDSFEYGLAVTMDPVGNLLVAGQFSGSATFSGTNLVSRGGLDAFLAKYDPAGNLVWITQGGGSAEDVARSVAVDGDGNSYISGWYGGTATFGPTNGSLTLTNAGGYDAFAAKYDSAGRLTRINYVASPQDDIAYGFGLDGGTNGNFLVWLGSTVASRLALFRFDATGNGVWTRTATVSSPQAARGGLAVDSAGNSYFTSQFSGTAIFGAQTWLAQGESDVFVVKYDAAGNLVWLKRAPGSSSEEGRAIALGPENNPVLTGWFPQDISFDGLNLASDGGNDVFVAKLVPPPALSILRSGNQAVVSWPSSPSGFQLQQIGALGASQTWQNVPATPALTSGRNVVTNDVSTTNGFFRLRR